MTRSTITMSKVTEMKALSEIDHVVCSTNKLKLQRVDFFISLILIQAFLAVLVVATINKLRNVSFSILKASKNEVNLVIKMLVFILNPRVFSNRLFQGTEAHRRCLCLTFELFHVHVQCEVVSSGYYVTIV